MKSVSAVDEKTFSEAIEKIARTAKTADRKINERIDTIKSGLKTGVDKGLQQNLDNLKSQVDENCKENIEFQDFVKTQLNKLREQAAQLQIPLDEVQKSAVHRSRTKSSINRQLSPKKDSASVKYSTIEENNKSPSAHRISELEAEMLLPEQDEYNEQDQQRFKTEENEDMNSFEEEKGSFTKLRRDYTKSSKPSSLNTAKLNTKIENFVGKDIHSIHSQLINLVQIIEELKMKVNENSEGININSKKLLQFMRSQKSNLSTQQKLALSIKNGIRQVNEGNYSTDKNLSKSYFSKFHSPRDSSTDEIVSKNKTFFSSNVSKNVSLIIYQ